jgi:hypothetical protein
VQRFQAGDAAEALANIRNAQDQVQRALAAAGLSTPADGGVRP